ncbi:MAG: FkbM family methyltransferase [Candidatus Omnitrophica bacterium]|nr:FkbM family methyltransferase [Candidatus Omnitrophota bacterium]
MNSFWYKFHFFVCKIINVVLYRRLFFLYKPAYFLYKGISEREKIDQLTKIIKPGMTVLDIGANIGYYTILFSKLVGKEGKVHAFEPDALNFSYLKKNTKGLDNVILNNAAVGEKSGDLFLYHSETLNVDCKTYDSGENRKKTKIACIAIDDYLSQNQRVDFIKIDIQGFEYFAMKGMEKTIQRSANVAMVGEYSPSGLKKSGIEPGDYLNFLETLGFKIEFENNFKKENLTREKIDDLFYIDFFAKKSL